ncbi:MAG: hypothetical protein JWQ90_1132 [Hydrocarboniphaga sp.]|uniref:Zn-ribbon domain-containing OB-fold protein n=1 Tax=Hydrocarboniphaga sp. TaxID=2033016 RepID=UPI00260B4912|nr:OB-fold domain-containing protein [Hydrocarboniphaga sp.]MDB5968682.1 hypothetical protein [Hydrocarboniphaga sp.]
MTSEALSDEAVFAAFPGVLIDRDNIAHYRGIIAGKLLINRCSGCGYWVYPHRPLCPQCLSWDVQATEVSGRGKVFMFTLIQQQRDPNNRLREPIIAAAVELVEQNGLRYLARIVNCLPDEVRPDMPVQLTWIAHEGQVSMPAFEPMPAWEG